MKSVMIGIPTRNGDKYIADIVRESKQYGDVIVYDDGSTDETRSKALEAGAHVLTNQGRGKGYGIALQSLFEYAKDRYEYFVILDGDGKYDPSEIPIFLSAIKDADVVIGSRFLSDNEGSKHREALKESLNQVAGVSDSECRFRAYNRKAIQSIDITEDGYSALIELLHKTKEKGLKLIEVPCTMPHEEIMLHERERLRHIAAHVADLIESVFWGHAWPRLTIGLGILAIMSFIVSLYFGIYLAYFYIRSGDFVFSYALLAIGSLQVWLILCISMLLVMVLKKLLDELNSMEPPRRGRA